MTLQGGCLCGVVRYELDQLDMPVAHRHCVTCRKAHAAACVSTAGVMRGRFRCTAGTERLATSELSPGKLRRFCSECGTHLLAERPGRLMSCYGWRR
jgi:ADP-ribosyl-[dinitrogen reductase] hydrolase